MNADATDNAHYATPLRPVRGLICGANDRGQPFETTAVQQWMRYTQFAHKVEKCDIFLEGARQEALSNYLRMARTDGIALSLATTSIPSTERLEQWVTEGLFDLHVYGDAVFDSAMNGVLRICTDKDLGVRLWVAPPFPGDFQPGTWLDTIAGTSVTCVTFALAPPLPAEAGRLSAFPEGTLKTMTTLARELDGRGVEAHLLDVPFCVVPEDARGLVLNRIQFFQHHQYYDELAYTFAESILRSSPKAMSGTLEYHLTQPRSMYRVLDRSLFPWVLDKPWIIAKLWALHKLSRVFRRPKARQPLPENPAAMQERVERTRHEREASMRAVCRPCRYRHICDQATPAFEARFPGVTLKAEEGELVHDPFGAGGSTTQHFDAIDEARRTLPERIRELTGEAQHVITAVPPTRTVQAREYHIEGQFTDYLPAAVRWWSFTPTHYESTILEQLHPPFTISVQFGGGMAERIGFGLGPYTKVVCPMIDASHRLTLHVGADGRYVLLRDGEPVRPTAFAGVHYVPEKLPSICEPRLSVWGIDGQILTQNVQTWRHDTGEPETPPSRDYSVILVCTKYSRRLQAVLQGLAHQRGFDLERLEILVGYVPGLDATDDVLDSMAQAHPTLNLLRVPFTRESQRAKGRIINEAVRLSRGKRIVLLDSDIVVPPDFFGRLDSVPEETPFMAPEGRKMLPPAVTAKVLIGEVRPWESYGALMEGVGELVQYEGESVPPGFCQCVRRDVLEAVPYVEVDHFEGADWIFADQVIKTFGKEHRIEGLDVLHLDHGGSQWYGANRHL